MTTAILRDTLLWCTILNYCVLFCWFVVYGLPRHRFQQIHGRWFRLAPEQFDAIHYGGMAVYKIGILLLNLVPYLALRIVA
jgi:hypothetical protein